MKKLGDIFSDIKFNITVDSHVSRTYDIKQPIGSKDIGDDDGYFISGHSGGDQCV